MSSAGLRIVAFLSLSVLCDASVCTGLHGSAESVFVEFTQERPPLQYLLDQGIHAKPLGGLEAFACRVENVDVTIKLPYAEGFQVIASVGSFDLSDGMVASLWFSTDKLSHDDVYAMALHLHEVLGIDVSRLDEWIVQAAAAPATVKWYFKPNDEREPRAAVAIRRSYNKNQPWILYVHIEWFD